MHMNMNMKPEWRRIKRLR